MTEVAEPRTQTSYIRLLGPADFEKACALTDLDVNSNVFIRHRIMASGLDSRWLGAEMWGWFEAGHLTSLLHVGTNVVPAMATSAAIEAFVERLIIRRTKPSSLVGPAHMVLPMWEALEPHWGQARSVRPAQPLMTIRFDSDLELDRRVRQVRPDEIDMYYPACVAMFKEELGFDPDAENTGGYRARIVQLLEQGWAWAIIDNGRVLFKAEVGAAGPRACQIQGVWVAPGYRNHGVATFAMASVVRQVRREVAPVVTLYVNDHNVAAREVYERVGFKQTGTFASVLI